MTARKGPQRPPSKRTVGKRVEKHIALLDLYLSGKTGPEIAAELGYENRQNVYRALKSALQQRAAERADLADQALEMQLGRFDKLLDVHMRIALNEKNPLDAARSANIVLQIADRTAKLLGLDQPQRVDVTVSTVDDVDREISELAAALTAKARADGANIDVPVLEAIIGRGTGEQ